MKLVVLTQSEGSTVSNLGFEVHTSATGVRSPSIALLWGHPYNGGNRNIRATLNSGPAIQNNLNKRAALEEVSETLCAPKCYHDVVPSGVEAIVRPVEHSRGEGYRVVTGSFRIPLGHYAVKAVKADKEYRVWYANGQMIAAQRVAIEGNDNRSEEFPCRSKWGYSVRDLGPKMAAITKKAAEALNMKYGAVDLLFKSEPEPHYYFLEWNSAPSLDAPRVIEFFKANVTRHYEAMLDEASYV